MKMLVLIGLILNLNIFAKTVEGQNFLEKEVIEGKTLHLNGIGIRKATFFKVKVYVGGLYLSKKTSDINEILEQEYPKYLEMKFVRSVDKDKLVGGWNDAFKAALSTDDLKKAQKSISEFNATMGDIEKNQSIRLIFLKDIVKVSFNQKDYQIIKGTSFAKHLLSVWFLKPKDENLAKGLRGLN